MPAVRRFVLRCCLLGLLAAGCSSTREIETAPPRPAVPVVTDTTGTAMLAPLTVLVEMGPTALPADVQAMQFRVAEVHLKPTDGAWTSYPADVNSFLIAGNRRTRKAVLSTRVPPAAYDSLAVSLSEVFVQYGANAGGPLTLPRRTPLRLPLTTSLAIGRSTTIRLVFEPGASLSRTDDCRWFFLPFFEARVE